MKTATTAPAFTGTVGGSYVRVVALVLTVLIVGFGLLELYATWTITFAGLHGVDFNHYLDGTRRWLATGSPYLPSEVAGPFQYQPESFLHPPIALLLFAAFLALPAVLWWVIPLAVIGWVIGSLRPAPWTWPVMAALAVLPHEIPVYVVGNTDLWACAIVALGLRFGWPAVLMVIKPSLFPLGLIGASRRSWWIAAALIILVAIPFGSLWLDWASVAMHAPSGILYSIYSLPSVCLPTVAWIGRTSTARSS